jgi:hypothetical protein
MRVGDWMLACDGRRQEAVWPPIELVPPRDGRQSRAHHDDGRGLKSSTGLCVRLRLGGAKLVYPCAV